MSFGWIQTFGLPTVAIGVLGFLIARWQYKISKEKLRYDLYDRRFAIYMAFHELILASVEKQEFDNEIRNANAARAHAPFLLDPPLVSLLNDLHSEAFRINATGKLLKDESAWSSASERISKAAQHGQERLSLNGRLNELIEEFERFLRLKDFSSAY